MFQRSGVRTSSITGLEHTSSLLMSKKDVLDVEDFTESITELFKLATPPWLDTAEWMTQIQTLSAKPATLRFLERPTYVDGMRTLCSVARSYFGKMSIVWTWYTNVDHHLVSAFKKPELHGLFPEITLWSTSIVEVVSSILLSLPQYLMVHF